MCFVTECSSIHHCLQSPKRPFFSPYELHAVVNINAHFKAHISRHRLHWVNSSLKSEYINSKMCSFIRSCVKNHTTYSQYLIFKSVFITNYAPEASYIQVFEWCIICVIYRCRYAVQIGYVPDPLVVIVSLFPDLPQSAASSRMHKCRLKNEAVNFLALKPTRVLEILLYYEYRII